MAQDRSRGTVVIEMTVAGGSPPVDDTGEDTPGGMVSVGIYVGENRQGELRGGLLVSTASVDTETVNRDEGMTGAIVGGAIMAGSDVSTDDLPGEFTQRMVDPPGIPAGLTDMRMPTASGEGTLRGVTFGEGAIVGEISGQTQTVEVIEPVVSGVQEFQDKPFVERLRDNAVGFNPFDNLRDNDGR